MTVAAHRYGRSAFLTVDEQLAQQIGDDGRDPKDPDSVLDWLEENDLLHWLDDSADDWVAQ